MSAASPIERIAARGAPSAGGRRRVDASGASVRSIRWSRRDCLTGATRTGNTSTTRASRASPSSRPRRARPMPPPSPRGSCRSASARRVVLVDGRFAPGLSDFGVAAGLEILDLAALLERDAGGVARPAARAGRRPRRPLCAARGRALRRAACSCASRPDARLRSRSTSCSSRPPHGRPCTRPAS